MTHSAAVVALILAVLIAGLSVAARKLRISSPVLMLLAGAAIAFVPGAPRVLLDPQFVLLVLLPPVLYSSGVNMSWRGFRSNLRPILLLAVGCVLFTAGAVATVAHYALGIPWAVGFVLGAIVSPPDAVAPMAMLRLVRLPRRLVTILEGESLVNDATALVTLGFATAAVVSGTFSPLAAGSKFVVIVVGELAFGIAVGWAMLRLRHAAADPRAEVLLALASPFLAFWPPHAIGGSGVIACVAAGLYVSWHGRRWIRPATRLQGYFIWNLVVWATEALVFLLAGLQARTVVDSLTADEWPRALAAGALTTITVVVVRFLWVYPATYLPRLWLPAVRRNDPAPDWRYPFLISFAGVRGVVSLAAALLIPVQIAGGPFPERDIVLFATYCVIALTILGLGAGLRPLAGVLGLGRSGAHEATLNKQDERRVRIEGIDAVLDAIERAENAGASAAVVATLRRRHADRRSEIAATMDGRKRDDPVAEGAELQLELVGVERAAIARAYSENRITDEARRRIEREFDLEETRVRHALASVSAEDG